MRWLRVFRVPLVVSALLGGGAAMAVPYHVSVDTSVWAFRASWLPST